MLRSSIALVTLLALVLAGPAEAKRKKRKPLTVSVSNVRITEGGGAAFKVSLSKKSKRAVVVDYATADGSATAPGDYTARKGSLVIRPKKTHATIAVATVGDTIDEPDETFTLKLRKPLGAKIKRAKATATIVDDDPPATGSDIALTGSRFPAVYRGGAPLLYTLTVTNNGPQAADGVVVTDTLPAGATLFVGETSPSCAAANGTATCQLGALAAGASATVTVASQVPIPTSATNVSTAAGASSAAADPVPGNASYADAFALPAGNLSLGTSDTSMPRDGTLERKQETAEGDFVADAFRAAAGTQLAVVTGGALRAALTCDASVATQFCPNISGPPYSITRGAIWTALPFGNRVVTLSVSGTELWQMLAKSVINAPTAANAAFLQVSGFCFSYNQTTKAILSVQFLSGTACTGPAIPADSTQYSIAMNSFTVAGGDGYPDYSARATRLGFDADAVTDHLISVTPYAAPAVGLRIQAV